jgi:hypothetical protein
VVAEVEVMIKMVLQGDLEEEHPFLILQILEDLEILRLQVQLKDLMVEMPM